jgi:Sulfotransferase domain
MGCMSRTAVKRKIKGISPLVAPTYARVRSRVSPLLGPVSREFRHLRVRRGDAFLASYPRSGNTWLRFMLFEALTGTPAEFHSARRAIPHVNPYRDTRPLLSNGARLFLTHEQYGRHYRRAAAVYLVRDVRDVVISEYGRQRMNLSYAQDFDHFLEDFLRGRIHRFGSWADHVAGWIRRASMDGSLLLLRYEDLKRDTSRALGEVLRFLGEPRPVSVIRTAVANNSLEAMRKKEDQIRLPESRPGFRFVNKGESGSWREQLDARQILRIEEASARLLQQLGYDLESQSMS